MRAKRISVLCLLFIAALCVTTLALTSCKKAEVYSVALSETYVELNAGDVTKLTAIVDANTLKTETNWSSAHTNVATVSDDGLVTAIAAGATSVKAVCGDKAAVCTVVVKGGETQTPIERIDLSAYALTLKVNQIQTLTATVFPSDPAGYSVSWASLDTSIATVDGNGKVTARSSGVTVVTATCGNRVAVCKITVTDSASSDGRFSFKTLTVNGNEVTGNCYSNEFSFEDEIECGADVKYIVCRDLECSVIIRSKVAVLNMGRNDFYILASYKGNNTLYRVTIDRLGLYGHSIYFDTKGGSEISSIIVPPGETVYYSNLPVPVKAGYDFVKWTTETDGDGGDIAVVVTSAVTLHAVYTPKKYEATFDLNGGKSNVTMVKVDFDSEYNLFAPKKEGCYFDGWFVGDTKYTDGDGHSLGVWKFTQNTVFTAHWKEGVKLALVADGYFAAELEGEGVYQEGQSVTVSANQCNLGYEWKGWFDGEKLLTADLEYTLTIPDSNVTLTAKWREDSRIANLSYYSTQKDFEIRGVTYNSLTEVTIPEYTTSIVQNVFASCDQLSTVNYLAKRCRRVSYAAFYPPFENCPIETLTIGGEVEFIPERLFYSSSVKNVYYDGNLESWCKIDFEDQYANPLLYAKNLYLNGERLNEVELPRDIQISKYAFGNLSFDSVNYLGTLSDWCAMTFESSYSNPATRAKNFYIQGEPLGDVTLPQGVEKVGQYAFCGISSIASVTFPQSLACIESYAFQNCNGLTRIKFGANVASVGYNAFYSCDNLKSVYFDGTVADWCGIDFGNEHACPLSEGGDLYIANTLVENLEIPAGVTEIKNYAFAGGKLKSVLLPDSVTDIGNYAFNFNRDLVSCSFSENLKTIGDNAFRSCGLTGKVVIPDSVTSIGVSAFGGCNTITDLKIGSGVKVLPRGAFSSCTKLVNVELPQGLEEIGFLTFSNCQMLQSINIPDSLKTIGNNAFGNCLALADIVIPDGVSSIGNNIVVNTAVKSIVLPISVKTLGRLTSNCSVFYMGGLQEWSQIEFTADNENFALLYFYSETEPALNDDGSGYDGEYWRYVDGQITIWSK